MNGRCVTSSYRADALKFYSSHLTSYEIDEIHNYREIWFVGLAADKVKAVTGAALNNGYDDQHGSYLKVFFIQEILPQLYIVSFLWKTAYCRTADLSLYRVTPKKKAVTFGRPCISRLSVLSKLSVIVVRALTSLAIVPCEIRIKFKTSLKEIFVNLLQICMQCRSVLVTGRDDLSLVCRYCYAISNTTSKTKGRNLCHSHLQTVRFD